MRPYYCVTFSSDTIPTRLVLAPTASLSKAEDFIESIRAFLAPDVVIDLNRINEDFTLSQLSFSAEEGLDLPAHGTTTTQ